LCAKSLRDHVHRDAEDAGCDKEEGLEWRHLDLGSGP
jgi:hypothetical protein